MDTFFPSFLLAGFAGAYTYAKYIKPRVASQGSALLVAAMMVIFLSLVINTIASKFLG
jgi:hypothetical protein